MYNSNPQCLLGFGNSGGVCIFLYIVAGVTFLLCLIIGVLQCVTCDFCGLGGIVDWIVAFLGCLVWVVAAAVASAGMKDQDNADQQPPQNPDSGDRHKWRLVTVILSWVIALLFLIISLAGIARFCAHRRRNKK